MSAPNNARYDINDLLRLAFSECAEALHLKSEEPPAILVYGEIHIIEGPAITAENIDSILRSLAGTRHMREFLRKGAAAFVYSFEESQVRVDAKQDNEDVVIEMRRIAG